MPQKRGDCCFFNLRYNDLWQKTHRLACGSCQPFWHDELVWVQKAELTELCRAALWYSRDIHISHSQLHGIRVVGVKDVIMDDADAKCCITFTQADHCA